MSSSDDDVPLGKANGRPVPNGKSHSGLRFDPLAAISHAPRTLSTLEIIHRTNLHLIRHCFREIMSAFEADIAPSGVAKSSSMISSATDRALDKQIPSGSNVRPGISVRNGPVDAMDVDKGAMNGVNGKRKSRGSVVQKYRESSASEDDKPLVRFIAEMRISLAHWTSPNDHELLPQMRRERARTLTCRYRKSQQAKRRLPHRKQPSANPKTLMCPWARS